MENTKKIGENLYLVEVEPTISEANAHQYAELLAKIQQKDALIEKIKGVLRDEFTSVNLIGEIPEPAPKTTENEYKNAFWFGVFIALVMMYLILMLTMPKDS